MLMVVLRIWRPPRSSRTDTLFIYATLFRAPGNLVILESTSPVGTTEKVAAQIAELRPDLKVPGACTGAADIFIAHCPERVLPGRILVELVDNDRCIGGITPRCARRSMNFYRQFVRGACVTPPATRKATRLNSSH